MNEHLERFSLGITHVLGLIALFILGAAAGYKGTLLIADYIGIVDYAQIAMIAAVTGMVICMIVVVSILCYFTGAIIQYDVSNME